MKKYVLLILSVVSSLSAADRDAPKSYVSDSPKFQEVRRSMLYGLGECEYNNGDIAAAESYWLKSANLGHGLSMFALGEIKKTQGNIDEARGWYTKAAANGIVVEEEALKDAE